MCGIFHIAKQKKNSFLDIISHPSQPFDLI